MDEQELDGSEVLETTEETVEGTLEEESEGATEETLTREEIETLKAKAAKADELEKTNKQLFERAKKAEGSKKSEDGLSTQDTIYLAKADIHEDDVNDVIEMAKLKKITVQEAHKFLKPILNERKEERATAAVAAVGRQRPGSTKVPDESILRKAIKDGLPEDDEEIQRLVEADLARKTKKA